MATTLKEKWTAFWKEEANLFVIKLVGVYFVWRIIHHFLLSPSSGAIHEVYMHFALAMGSFYATVSSGVLNLFGQETRHIGYAIQYPVSLKALLVEEHCLAVPAIVIFTGVIVLFSGSWKNKAWFIPLGIFGIFAVNALRLILLAYAYEHYSITFFQFNHSYVYVITTYSVIFLMIVWWMKTFSREPVVAKAV